MDRETVKPMKIGYFADGPWAHGTFHLLINNPNYLLEFICIRYKTQDPVLINLAKEHGVTLYCVQNINDDSFHKCMLMHQCHIFVSMSFDQIFKEKLYSIPRFGTINCHAGMLPYYRGRNILNWALINGEKNFGITVHYIDSGIDTGDIILQESFPISVTDDYQSLLETAYRNCPRILDKAIEQIYEGKAKRIAQKSIALNGTIYPQRVLGDEIIDWSQSSEEIFNFIRALTTPGPLAETHIDNCKVKIIKSILLESAPSYKAIPGAILSREDGGFLVKTGDSYLKIVEWESSVKIRAGERFV